MGRHTDWEEGRYALTPFADNGIYKDFHLLESCGGGGEGGRDVSLSNQCCVCVHEETDPQGPSATTGRPVNCPSISLTKGCVSQGRLAQSLWRLRAWQVASRHFWDVLLGPWALQVEEAGVEDFQREGQRRDSKGKRGR